MVGKSTRAQQITARLTALVPMALDDDTPILPASLAQCQAFFASHADVPMPKLIVTPDGTLRTRWIGKDGAFVALEWTGESLVCMVIGDRGPDGALYHNFLLVPPDHVATLCLDVIMDSAPAKEIP